MGGVDSRSLVFSLVCLVFDLRGIPAQHCFMYSGFAQLHPVIKGLCLLGLFLYFFLLGFVRFVNLHDHFSILISFFISVPLYPVKTLPTTLLATFCLSLTVTTLHPPTYAHGSFYTYTKSLYLHPILGYLRWPFCCFLLMNDSTFGS